MRDEIGTLTITLPSGKQRFSLALFSSVFSDELAIEEIWIKLKEELIGLNRAMRDAEELGEVEFID